MHLSKTVGMESWITIEVSTMKIQSAQLFLSVLIQFLTSNDWDARITICLCPDCWRACLGAQFRLIQLNKFRICSKIKWFGLMYTTCKLIAISYSIFKIRLHFNALYWFAIFPMNTIPTKITAWITYYIIANIHRFLSILFSF